MSPVPTPIKAQIQRLGQRVQERRLALDWSQAHLAEVAGISLATLSRLERGHSVQLAHWLSVLTALGLGGALDQALPPLEASPLAAWRQREQPKRRASRTGEQRGRPNPDWRWGDETPDESTEDQP